MGQVRPPGREAEEALNICLHFRQIKVRGTHLRLEQDVNPWDWPQLPEKWVQGEKPSCPRSKALGILEAGSEEMPA